MTEYAEIAIELINELHTERLEYESEYVPLIEAAIRLSEYEDIGFSPEELQELAEYKRNNRIYLLPCAIGSKVYMITQRLNDLTGYAYPVIIQSSFRLNMIDDLNKSVFLTREEADAALEKIRMEESV